MASLKTPVGWTSLGRAPREHKLELTFAVKQTNTAGLEAALMNAADPDSPNYGSWLSNDAVHQLIAPAAASVEAVRTFLTANGVADFSDVTPNGDFITAAVTIPQAEALLSTTYETFQHTNGHVVHRARSYTLPAEVAAAVDFVSPTVQLPTIRTTATSPVDTSFPTGNTPKSLRVLYNVGDVMGGASPKTKQAVTAFLGQLYSASDLASFYKQYWPTGDVDKIKLVGDAKPGRGGIESMLDIECA